MSRLAETIELIGSPRLLNKVNTFECVILMKEFLRREAIWANILGLVDEIPFVDLASSAKCAMSLEDLYKDKLTTFTYSVAEYRCCLAMLNWYGHPGPVTIPPPLGVDDPYLPLLQFFRLGGTFTREHRVFIDINFGEMIHSVAVQKGDLTTAFVALGG